MFETWVSVLRRRPTEKPKAARGQADGQSERDDLPALAGARLLPLVGDGVPGALGQATDDGADRLDPLDDRRTVVALIPLGSRVLVMLEGRLVGLFRRGVECRAAPGLAHQFVALGRHLVDVDAVVLEDLLGDDRKPAGRQPEGGLGRIDAGIARDVAGLLEIVTHECDPLSGVMPRTRRARRTESLWESRLGPVSRDRR